MPLFLCALPLLSKDAGMTDGQEDLKDDAVDLVIDVLGLSD